MMIDVKIDKIVLLAVVLIAVILIGEIAAYGPNPHRYSAGIEAEGGTVNVSVSSSGSDVYAVIFMENGEYSPPAQIYIFLDERYAENFDEAKETAKLRKTDQRYAADQVRASLGVRGVGDVLILNENELLSAMTDDIGSGIPKGLLVMTYALPESIYSGSDTDLIFKWTEEGNSLYWMNSPAGAFYRSGNVLVPVDNGQDLFFGKECINTNGADLALYEDPNRSLTKALSLKWNRTINGLNISGIPGAVSMGFEQDGFSSVSMVPFGKGMICVLGGAYDRNQCDDLSQIISSGVSCYSEILAIEEGKVTRGSAEISFTIPAAAENIRISVLIGGYYTVFGRAFDVQ